MRPAMDLDLAVGFLSLAGVVRLARHVVGGGRSRSGGAGERQRHGGGDRGAGNNLLVPFQLAQIPKRGLSRGNL